MSALKFSIAGMPCLALCFCVYDGEMHGASVCSFLYLLLERRFGDGAGRAGGRTGRGESVISMLLLSYLSTNRPNEDGGNPGDEKGGGSLVGYLSSYRGPSAE